MSRWIKVATVVAVAAILAITTGGAGATSSPARTTSAKRADSRAAHLLEQADFKTLAGAQRYLRAIGIKPRGLVLQRGIRNYAGPKCPGAGWSCTTTTHPVIQIGHRGGTNRFVCTSNACAVVQAARATGGRGRSLASATATPTVNTAVCVKTTGLTQSCSITQSNAAGTNQAIVYENAGKQSGLTQTVSYQASINQTATGTNANQACVNQMVNIDGTTNLSAKKGTPVNVNLNATQSIAITQNAVSGGNTVQNAVASGSSATCDLSTPTDAFFVQKGITVAPLVQSQTLTSDGTGAGPVTQSENAAATSPNISLTIAQNETCSTTPCSPTPGYGASGVNIAPFWQTSTLVENAVSPTGPVTQKQGTKAGGIRAQVNQFSHDQSQISKIAAKQEESQCAHAQPSGTIPAATFQACKAAPAATFPAGYQLSQPQAGPIRKGGGDSQGDTPADTFDVKQTSTQKNDTGNGQTNTVEGDCSTLGACNTDQTATVNNAQPSQTSQTGQNVSSSINCTGTACPTTPMILSGPTQPTTGSTTATFTFKDGYTGAGFLCDLDGGGYTSCGTATNTPGVYSKSYTVSCAASHTFSIKATAGTDVTQPATYSWTVPICTPAMDSGPGGNTSGGHTLSTSATFVFHDTGHVAAVTPTYECKIDAASYQACSSGQAFTVSCAGAHVFSVRTTDAAHDVTDPATWSWTVPMCDPVIDSGPTQPTTMSTDATFQFHTPQTADAAATMQCQLDGGSPSDCSSGSASYSNLACGSHTFSVQATDVYSETTAATTYSWSVGCIIFDGSPATGAPPATLGTYAMSAFGADPQPLGDVSGVTDPAGAISFSPDLHHDTVPNGGWNNWSNNYTGDVYDTCFQGNPGCTAADPSHVRITLPAGTNAFYFYSEANSYDTFTLQATAQNGTTSGPVQVTTPGGATYFGFYGTGGATIAYIDVTANDARGFAVGEFGINHS